jgi:hypothetical protein
MDSYVFHSKPFFKRQDLIADMMIKFDLEIWRKDFSATILQNDNLLVDIDCKWVCITIINNVAELSKMIENYFINRRKNYAKDILRGKRNLL